jgi:hypothetical protein
VPPSIEGVFKFDERHSRSEFGADRVRCSIIRADEKLSRLREGYDGHALSATSR